MKKITMVLMVLILSAFQIKTDYPLNKKGQPTTFGIRAYVKDQQTSVIDQVQNILKDTIREVYIVTDNIESYVGYNEADAGYYYSSSMGGEVIISNREIYVAYDVASMTKQQKRTIRKTSSFVRSCIIHELGHCYINQVTREMRMDSLVPHSDYGFTMLPRYTFGASFIEEGICEYLVKKSGEIIDQEHEEYVPESVNEIMSPDNKYKIVYEYSVEYLWSFIEYFGVKEAIKKLMVVRPPSAEEILYPIKFYNRVNENKN